MYGNLADPSSSLLAIVSVQKSENTLKGNDTVLVVEHRLKPAVLISVIPARPKIFASIGKKISIQLIGTLTKQKYIFVKVRKSPESPEDKAVLRTGFFENRPPLFSHMPDSFHKLSSGGPKNFVVDRSPFSWLQTVFSENNKTKNFRCEISSRKPGSLTPIILLFLLHALIILYSQQIQRWNLQSCLS